MIGIYIHFTVAVLALVMGFVAQWALPPRRRTRIIFMSAAAPAGLLVIAAVVAPLFVEMTRHPDLSWFQLTVNLTFAFTTMLFAGLIGASLGTELASLTRWLLRRRS